LEGPNAQNLLLTASDFCFAHSRIFSVCHNALQ